MRVSSPPRSSSSTMRTTPRPPSTSIVWPVLIRRLALSTPTTAGMPYSRATTDPCDIAPPISITSPAAVRKSGVQPGSVDGATRISPGSQVRPDRVEDHPRPAAHRPGRGRRAAQGALGRVVRVHGGRRLRPVREQQARHVPPAKLGVVPLAALRHQRRAGRCRPARHGPRAASTKKMSSAVLQPPARRQLGADLLQAGPRPRAEPPRSRTSATRAGRSGRGRAAAAPSPPPP